MPDILYNAANNFKKVVNNNYELIVGNGKKRTTFLIPSVDSSEFTHIFGLDHLSDIRMLVAKNATQKSAILKKILSKQISFKDILNSKYLNSPILSSYNYENKSEYTIHNRIKLLSDFENIIDNAYKGKVYKWNLNKCQIKLPDGKYRKTTINADYLITIPSDNDREIFYLFAYQTNKFRNKSEPIYLNIFSAFPDGIDLTSGQEKPYTILEERKNGFSIYTHPSYRKELKESSLSSDQKITIKNDIKALKSKRSDYIFNSDEKTRTAYEKRLSIFQNRNIYTPEMLEIVADRLKAQLDDPHNSAVAETIKKEIEYIQNEAEQRRKEPDRPTEKSISIVKNQLNADGTISSETAAEIPVPNVKKISQKAQRNTHTVVGSINSLISDVKDFFNALKKPKKQTPVKKKTPSSKLKNSVKTVDKSVSQQRKKSIEISKKVQKTTPEKSVHNTPEKPVDKPYMSIKIIKEEARRIREERIKNPGPKKEKSHSHEIE